MLAVQNSSGATIYKKLLYLAYLKSGIIHYIFILCLILKITAGISKSHMKYFHNLEMSLQSSAPLACIATSACSNIVAKRKRNNNQQ